jgi:hypothetical protein
VKTRSVVVGVADHTGWALLVCAAAVNGEPVVVDRREVRLVDAGVPAQPYEHDTSALAEDEAESLIRTVKRSIAARTAHVFEQLGRDLSPTYRVAALSIREPTLERLPASVTEARASYHVRNRADGMLYHSAICAAARKQGWDVVLHRRGEELARAAAALHATEDDVARFLGALRKSLRPPWSAEHRQAFAAAIAGLEARPRLRLRATE